MRHRFIFSLSVLVAVALVVAGCSEQGTTAPTSSAVSTLADGESPLLSAHAGNRVGFSARGSGHKDGALAGGDPRDTGWRTFSFNAVQREGATTGHMQQNRHGGGQIQHGRVFCMADLGSEFVLIGAQGTQRIPENQPPNPFAGLGVPSAERPDNHGMFFVVKDNGEPGANAPADQFTGYISTTLGFVAGICAAGPNHPLAGLVPGFLNDVEAGNIQVTFP
jgi:hypothetical protein